MSESGSRGLPPGPSSPLDGRHLRHALGRFATGVTVVTCRNAEGGFVGLTVNSFNSLSLQPPLVLWSLREHSPNQKAFLAAANFAINVLAEDQVNVSRRFAASGHDRFAEGAWSLGAHGAPVLAGCTAVFECASVSQQEMGDHRLFIGQVLAYSQAALKPLLFQAGHYRTLGEAL